MSAALEHDLVKTDRLVAQIAAASVLMLDGNTTRLRELWREVPTVTGFIRHFGCLFCHQMVEELVAGVPYILERGARVVIVGNGSVAQARHFFSDKQLPRHGVSVVTDPDRDTYRAAGFERGVTKTLNSDSVKAYGAAVRQGHRVTGLFGDLTQLGGLIVVKPPASLLYFHKSRFAGDHPRMADVLAALPARVDATPH
jgi:hypothetical protein